PPRCRPKPGHSPRHTLRTLTTPSSAGAQRAIAPSNPPLAARNPRRGSAIFFVTGEQPTGLTRRETRKMDSACPSCPPADGAGGEFIDRPGSRRRQRRLKRAASSRGLFPRFGGAWPGEIVLQPDTEAGVVEQW